MLRECLWETYIQKIREVLGKDHSSRCDDQ